MLLVVGVVFFLSACSEKDEGTTADKGADTTTQTEMAAQQNRECWQSSVIQQIYEAAGGAAMGAYGSLTSGALTVSMLAFAFWFAWKMMTYLSSFTEQNMSQIWTEVARQFFVCWVCGMLAGSSDMLIWTLNTLIFPIFYSFLELGAGILDLAQADAMSSQCVAGENIPYQNLSCSATNLGSVSSSGFPSGPVEMMKCMICSISSRLSLGFRLGVQLRAGTPADWIAGALLSICFIIVKMTFVFYLVDAVFRMTMMLVLAPLLILAYPFKPTRPWTVQGVKIIFNVSALMMFMGVVLSMVLLAIQEVITNYQGLKPSPDIEGDNSGIWMVVLLLAFLTIGSLDIAKAVTDGLVGGGGQNGFSSKGAKILAWIGKRLLDSISSGATKLVYKYAEKNEKIRDFLKKKEEINKELRKLAGRGGEGNTDGE